MTIPRVGMEVVVNLLGGNPDCLLITDVVPNKTTPVPYVLPVNKSRTVLRSRNTPNSGGYNKLSIEGRADQERIFLYAQRGIKQLILNDSHTSIGNGRHGRINRGNRSLVESSRFEQVNTNSSSLIKGGELHTTQGERHIWIGGSEPLSVSDAGSIAMDGTWVVQAGSQACVTATNMLVDTGASLTLRVGGQYIVISSAGTFNSMPIVRGGAPMAGIIS